MEVNCPFYGRHLVRLRTDPPFLLVPSHGNQCAIITTAHAPCELERAGVAVEWSTCPRLSEILTPGAARPTPEPA